MPSIRDRLIEAAARDYLPAGFTPYCFARGKLRQDPVFFALLAMGVFPARGQLTDFGCGQGSLIAILLAARDAYARGDWPTEWPAPPTDLALYGVDLRPAAVRTANRALGARARIVEGDVRTAPIPPSDAIAILDVLHYIGPAEQIAVLRRCHAALKPGGLFVTRVGDADAGLRFLITRLGDKAITILRGSLWPRFHCRSAKEWQRIVADSGFDVEAHPMSAGTPFANVLLLGHKR
jgi:SAM-dependent methyltransferase